MEKSPFVDIVCGFFHGTIPVKISRSSPSVSSLKVSGRYLILVKLRARLAGSVRRPTHHRMGFRQGPQVSQRKKPKTWHFPRAQNPPKVAANKVQQNKTYKLYIMP
jgi:hypothetical protein